MSEQTRPQSEDQHLKLVLTVPQQHGEKGPICGLCRDGRLTWCSQCRQWSSTCCQEYGTCQCS